jgi:hypothetical protein
MLPPLAPLDGAAFGCAEFVTDGDMKVTLDRKFVNN